MIRKIIEKHNFSPLNPSKIELWRGLGGVFGESWGVLGSPGESWMRQKTKNFLSWGSWERLGGFWRRLEANLSVLGGFLRRLWNVLGALGMSQASKMTSKLTNIEKKNANGIENYCKRKF